VAHKERTVMERKFISVTRVVHIQLDTHESLCSGTMKASHMSTFWSDPDHHENSTVPSPPIWGCLVITIDCRAGEGEMIVTSFPSAPGVIRNHVVGLA
jgi:hypothetical protein